MKVLTTEGQEVIVRWQYETVDVILADKLINTTTKTTCFLEFAGEIVFQASVKKLHTDVQDKDEARKESLKKVLIQYAYPIKKPEILTVNGVDVIIDEGDDDATVALNKAGRTAFWDAYRARKNKGVIITDSQAVPL